METVEEKLKKIKELVDSNTITYSEYYDLKREIEENSTQNKKNNFNSNEENTVFIKLKRKHYISLCLLVFYLSFHIVPSEFAIFPKDHFTFSNTIILQSDIDKIIDKFNDTDGLGRIIMLQNPLINKLYEKGILVTINQ